MKTFSFNFVKNYFKSKSCKLLEISYINSTTKMQYICSCKSEEIHKITFSRFKMGARCRDCGHTKQELSLKKFKDYIMPSKTIRRIQGYEHLALNELTILYKEDDIITQRKDMPKINYSINNRIHRYYPDILIKSKNKIIEVKSNYTYKLQLVKNIHKALATKKMGYLFEFWIYTPQKKKVFSKLIL